MVKEYTTTTDHIDLQPAFDDIDELWTAHLLNRNEQAITAIGVLIAYGINRKRQLCGVMKRLGFKPSHIALMVIKSAGNDPERHHWYRDDQGFYRLFHAPMFNAPIIA